MNVKIRYITDYGTAPDDVEIESTSPLTSQHLPPLSVDAYKFLGWVNINSDGHESSLSERMTISKDWIIKDSSGTGLYVVFTAKWKTDRKTDSGLSIASGTLTGAESVTIETGLSSIEVIAVYKGATTAIGLVQFIYTKESGKIYYTACSSYDTYVKTISSGTNTTYFTISGGNFTYSPTTDTMKLVSGSKYYWTAVGTA